MRKIIAIFVLLFGCLGHGYSQDLLSGVVYDKATDAPIGYALVGVNEKYVGIVSDEFGRFTLEDSDKVVESDSITITCLGYHEVKLAVKDVRGVRGDSTNIYMTVAPLRLAEVVVRTARKKDIKIGFSSSGTRMLHANLFSKSEIEGNNSNLGIEIGAILKIKDDSDIKSVNFYLTGNAYDSLKLRVLFYSVEDELPKDLIVNQDIIFEIVDNKKGWINVDLTPYNIRLDGDTEVAVSIMALDDTDPKHISVSGTLLTRSFVSRSKAQGEWTTFPAGMAFYLGAIRYRYK